MKVTAKHHPGISVALRDLSVPMPNSSLLHCPEPSEPKARARVDRGV
jgi:hypothetical protein